MTTREILQYLFIALGLAALLYMLFGREGVWVSTGFARGNRMKLRTGKSSYKMSKRFDMLHEGLVCESMRYGPRLFALSQVSMATLMEVKAQFKGPREVHGTPHMIAIDLANKMIWLHPTPDKPYQMKLRVSEIFEI